VQTMVNDRSTHWPVELNGALRTLSIACPPPSFSSLMPATSQSPLVCSWSTRIFARPRTTSPLRTGSSW
jgi:hypothetical protein